MKLFLPYKRLIVCFGMVLFFSFNGISANPERYLHFTEVDGLPGNITTCLETDQYGYLWIGTANGIARYDGKNFHNYKELSGISVNHLLYDSRHTLWVASYKGLFKY